MNTTMQTPFQFFREWAGFSYDPAKETPAQGKARGARSLAAAERWAGKRGIEYVWCMDPHIDSSDFSDEKPAWQLWQCALRYKGRCIASLHGIDFGRDGSPYSNNYARVVQAELADEAHAEGRIQ